MCSPGARWKTVWLHLTLGEEGQKSARKFVDSNWMGAMQSKWSEMTITLSVTLVSGQLAELSAIPSGHLIRSERSDWLRWI